MIADLARKEHLKLMLGFFESEDEFRELCNSAHRGLMDGVILGGVPHRELREMAYDLHRTGLPMITILEKPLHEHVLNIGLDCEATCGLSTRHLIDAGCKKIAHLNALKERYNGYRDQMKQAGLRVNPKWVYNCQEPLFSYETGVAAASFWLQQGTIPDGVVAQSDNQAMGVINTFQKAGIHCPRDIKITGVDNSPYCDFVAPSLTSVDQMSYKRGFLALESFIKLRDGNSADSVMLTPELHVRESSRLSMTPENPAALTNLF